MSEMKIHKGIAYEGVPKVLRSRVVNAAGTNITQAVTTAVTYIVDRYDSEEEAELDQNPTSVTAESNSGAVASLIFDTLQTWDEDSTGYNFQHTLPAASFPVGDKWYRIEEWIDATSGEDFPAGIWILYCHPTTKD